MTTLHLVLCYWIFSIVCLHKCVAVFKAGIYNAALHKQTWQSSEYREYTGSGKAVDGCSNVTEAEWHPYCCSHTSPQQDELSWWSVDLSEVHTIIAVHIVNRDHLRYRLSDFYIYGANNSHIPDEASKVLCAKKDGEVGEVGSFYCNQEIHAKFIIIVKQVPSYDNILVICEVEVEAKCLNGTYGIGCSKTCSEHCNNSAVCDKIDGKCPGGSCISGYSGDWCDTKCPQGTYGVDCKLTCPAFCKQVCDSTSPSGSCGGNCIEGYTGDNCAALISKEPDKSNNTLTILAVCVPSIIAIVAVALAIYWFIKYKKRSLTETVGNNPTSVAVYVNEVGSTTGNPQNDDNFFPSSENDKQSYEYINMAQTSKEDKGDFNTDDYERPPPQNETTQNTYQALQNQ